MHLSDRDPQVMDIGGLQRLDAEHGSKRMPKLARILGWKDRGGHCAFRIWRTGGSIGPEKQELNQWGKQAQKHEQHIITSVYVDAPRLHYV